MDESYRGLNEDMKKALGEERAKTAAIKKIRPFRINKNGRSDDWQFVFHVWNDILDRLIM